MLPLKPARIACGILILATLPALGQKFLPKSIQFKGAPEYSQEELLAAAGLKKGVVLSYAEMNDHSKRLLDTGAFDTLAFKFDGQDLIFQLTPSTNLLPIRLENLPLVPGKALDDRLHEKLPLFHGKVPNEDGMMEGVRVALEQMLADKGIKVPVVATLAPGDPKQHNRVTAIGYSITSVPVLVGAVHLEGTSLLMAQKAQMLASDAAKMQFSTTETAENLERTFETAYEDQGYAAVKVHAVQSGEAILTASSIRVPFAVRIEEGKIYKVGTVQLPEGAPITRAEVDKTLAERPGAPIEGVRLRTLWVSTRRSLQGEGVPRLHCDSPPLIRRSRRHRELHSGRGTGIGLSPRLREIR